MRQSEANRKKQERDVRNAVVRTFILVITAVVSLGLFQTVIAKGKPVNVEVTAAYPGDAFQGDALPVTITGSGFDSESQVRYLVTGTTDDTQVIVDQVEYISPSELRTHIRVNGNAIVSGYDIEVQNSSGRKGKGTTLFRVKQVETACTGLEDPEPEIAYLTGVDTTGDLDSQDIYLSSGSGCDQYLILKDAALAVPDDGDPKNGFGEELVAVSGLRFDLEGNEGVVLWRDTVLRPIPLLAIRFELDSNGAVVLDPAGAAEVYVPPDGYNAYGADVRINATGQVEVVTVEYAQDKSEWRIAHVNISSGSRALLTTGDCPMQDSSGLCFRPSYTDLWWNEDGTEVYFNPNSWPEAETNYVALARITRVNGGWQPAEILMKQTAQINVIGIRSDGLLAYEWLHYVPRRNGRTSFQDTYWVASAIYPDVCVPFECSVEEGIEMAADAEKYPRGWTRSGGMLFLETGPGAQQNIWEYADPISGVIGNLKIENVDGSERDTSY